MDAFRSHTQKSPADCGRRWEVVEIFQKNFSLKQVCAPPLSLLDKRTYRPCKNNNGRTEAPSARYIYIYVYNLWYVFCTEFFSFIHQRAHYIRIAFVHGPTIIITIRRARCIIILYTHSVILRPAAASIPLAAPTPKCLGRTK